MEEDEMDSLFEGMVLFNPSPISPPKDQIPPPPPPPPPISPFPPPLQELISSSSAPLDENLFSDLTLTTPIEPQTLESQPHLPTTTTTTSLPLERTSSSISRQPSRKKKKPGIRIGYGRDTTSLPEEPSPSPSPSSSIPIIQSELQEKPNYEDTHVEISPLEHIIDTRSEEKGDFEDTHTKILPSEPTIEDGVLEKCDFEDIGEETGVLVSTNEEDVSTSGDSTEEKLEQIRSRISEKLEEVLAMAGSVSATRKEYARKRRKAMESLSLASLWYKDLEKELEEACETEDFETAERVSDRLAAVEKEKEGLLSALRDAEADCDTVEFKMQEVLEMQIKAEEEGALLLEQFAKDAADTANLVLKNAHELSTKETTKWLSSVEALELKKMESEIELHLIKDARLGFNDSIDHLIEDDKREQETLCKKGNILNEELEILLALVREKEAEILENKSNIQVVEKRIADAVYGFHNIQSNLDTKFHDMRSVLSRIDSESEALSTRKKETDDIISQEHDRGRKLKELADLSITQARSSQELITLRKSLALPILKYREVKLKLAKTEEKVLEDIQILRQEVSTARVSLQELSSARSNMQQEITSAKQRIFFIDKRSPELEAEKRVAAAARNFKEAGRIAAEIKTLVVEKESIQTQMEADVLQLGNIEEELSNTVQILNEKEELILLKEKEVALSGCERLRLVSATAMAERSAALQLGDTEEANTLLAEAEAADSEARKLQQAYDLKEEEFENTAKDLISVELIVNLGRKQLAEMATSVSSTQICERQLSHAEGSVEFRAVNSQKH